LCNSTGGHRQSQQLPRKLESRNRILKPFRPGWMNTYRFINKGWWSCRSGLPCKGAIDESSTSFGLDNSETEGLKPCHNTQMWPNDCGKKHHNIQSEVHEQMTKMGYRQGAHHCTFQIWRWCHCHYCRRTQHAFAGRSYHRRHSRCHHTPPCDRLTWPGPRKGMHKSANKLFFKLKIRLVMSGGQAPYRRARWRWGGARGAQPPSPPVVVELCPSWPCLATLTALALSFVVVPLTSIVDVGPALHCLPSQGL
jgi:hypothetical protein